METPDIITNTTISFHNGIPLLPGAEEIKNQISVVLSPEEKGLSKDEKIAAVCKIMITYLQKFGTFGLLKTGTKQTNADFGYSLETGDTYAIKKENAVLAAFVYENFAINSASLMFRYAIQAWRHACFYGARNFGCKFCLL